MTLREVQAGHEPNLKFLKPQDTPQREEGVGRRLAEASLQACKRMAMEAGRWDAEIA